MEHTTSRSIAIANNSTLSNAIYKHTELISWLWIITTKTHGALQGAEKQLLWSDPDSLRKIHIKLTPKMRSLILCGFALICVVGGAPQVKWQKNSFLFNRNYPCVVHSLYSNASVNLYMLSPVFIGVIEFMNNAELMELIKDAVLYVHVCPNCQLLFPCVKWWRWLIVTNHGASYSSVDTVTFFYFVAYITHTWLRKRKRFFGEAYIWR